MTERTPIQPDDAHRLRFLQDAQLSPDGRAAVYAVNETDAEQMAGFAAIWLLTLDTGLQRRLTSGSYRDTKPQWSPDGKYVAFLRSPPQRQPVPDEEDGDQKAQIHIMLADGNDERALTALGQGVGSGPSWSPDGKYVAFTAGPAQETEDPGRAYRVTRHIYRFDALGYLAQSAQDIYVIPSSGDKPQQLTRDDFHNTLPVWSPDSKEILFCASMDPSSHRTYPGLRIVNHAGVVRELLWDWGYALSAAWTPDGQQVVFVGNPDSVRRGSQERLWTVNAHGGAPECRSTQLDLKVGGELQGDLPGDKAPPRILVTENGGVALVQVQEGGTVPIYRFALGGRESWSPVVTGERSCFPQSVRNGRLLFAASSLDNPMDLFISDTDGAGEQRLTHINADLLDARELPAIEHMSFSGKDGEPVEGWVLKPPIGKAPYPTVLYIHGGPHSGFGHVFSFDFQLLAGAGYGVLFINQRGSTGYGDAFSTQIIGDWGNLDYADLMAGVDAAIEHGVADPDRLGCCGLSGGGNLSCWIVGHTDRFKAAVPENPLTNWTSFYGVSDIGPWFAAHELGGLPHEIPDVYDRCSPITYAHRCRTPTLLIQGESDFRCPAEQSEQFYAVLKANGCTVEMLRLPHSPHAGSIRGTPLVREAQNQALLQWMNRFVRESQNEGDGAV